MPMDMMLDGIMPGATINAATKKLMNETANEFVSILEAKVSADQFDTVVFFTSVYDFMLYAKPKTYWSRWLFNSSDTNYRE